MNASLSVENRIQRALDELGEKLEAIIRELQAIRDDAKPIPVDFRNVIAIKGLLELRRSQAAQQ
jgi:hypothetical protein